MDAVLRSAEDGNERDELKGSCTACVALINAGEVSCPSSAACCIALVNWQVAKVTCLRHVTSSYNIGLSLHACPQNCFIGWHRQRATTQHWWTETHASGTCASKPIIGDWIAVTQGRSIVSDACRAN